MSVHCNEIIGSMIKSELETLSEIPYFLFTESNCDGDRFPTTNEFPVWEEDVSLLKLPQIRSIYIPPHAELRMVAKDNKAVFTIPGPTTIKDTDFHLSFWRNDDDSPCETGAQFCGKKVSYLRTDISSLKMVRYKTHDKHLHDLSVNKLPYKHEGREFTFNHYGHMSNLCNGPNPDKYSCACQLAYEDFIKVHGHINNPYVELLENTCDSRVHYHPDGAKSALGKDSECSDMIREMVQNETFPYKTGTGVNDYFYCNGKNKLSADVNGLNRTVEMFDDSNEDYLELHMDKSIPTSFWYILGALLIISALTFLQDYLERQKWKASFKIYKDKTRKS